MTTIERGLHQMLHPERGTGWLRTAVLYHIYPQSFQDTNGDGIGDLAGIDWSICTGSASTPSG
ncbi:hypothetical protein AMK25_05375 [Micromonospora sp. TSRI0369]|uniref:hypothetical protein n=1 Tax=Micromonospora sp. TSRI0369 TaxID=1703936 RepID=UPI00095C372E|nr:hypothetical protein [Micromonospora sp. TSRI0369]OKJ46000.1 hypothetical protein AMK25_05375 [Micromonospora sp. TSRI0369]